MCFKKGFFFLFRFDFYENTWFEADLKKNAKLSMILKFITSTLKSMAIRAIWLALSGVIYS